MSDETADLSEETEGAEEGDVQPGGKKKLIIIAAAGVLALVLIGGASWFFLLRSSPADSAAAAAQADPTYFYDLPPMTVNLNSEKDEFLKLSISLELANKGMVAIVEPRIARVIDAFQVYLRELRRSDLEGSAGIYRLKEELRRRVNLAIYPAEVRSILFKELLVQ